MAIPTNWDSKTGAQTSNTTSHPVTLPAVVSGQLLYVAMSFDGQPTVTWDNSTAGTWTTYVNTTVGTAHRLYIAAKVSDGTEGGKRLNITTSASEQSVFRAVSVQNWEGTLAGGLNIPAAATGVTTTPNPPAATDSWGTVDRKTVSVMCCDNGTRTISAYPSGYTLNQFGDTSGGTGGSVLGAAGRNANEGSQNPGTFTISASDDWVAATISIKGGTAGAGPDGWAVLDSGGSVGTFTTLASASISPAADALVVCLVNGMGVNTTDRVVPSSVANGGNSFTLIESEIIGPYSIGSAWRYLNASPFSGAVTITWSNSQDTASYVILQRTGVDTSGANGSGAVGTVAKSSGTSTSPSPGTISFAGSSNETFGANFWGDPASATVATHTKDADFVELSERADADSGWYTAISANIAQSQQTSHTATLTDSETWVAFGFEVKLAAGGTPVTLTTSLAAAVQAARAATAAMQAAVQAPQSATTGLATAVQQAFSAAASIDTVAQAAQAATAGLQLALQAARSAGTSTDAAVRAEHSSTTSAGAAIAVPATATAGLQAGVQTSATATTALEAAVQAARTTAASIDVAAQVAHTHTAALDALVQAERSASFGIDARVLGATSLTAQLQAAVQDGAQAQASAGAAVQLAQSATSAIAAAVQASRTAAADLQAAVQAARTATFGIDAQVQGGAMLAALVAAAVQQALQAGVGVDAAVQAERTAALGLSAQVQAGGVIAIGLEVAVLAAASATAGVQIAVQEARAASLGIAAAVSVQRVLTAAMAAATQVPMAVTCACSAYVESDAPPLPDWPAGGTARIGERAPVDTLDRVGQAAPVDTLDRVGQAAPGTRTTRIGSTALPHATKRIG